MYPPARVGRQAVAAGARGFRPVSPSIALSRLRGLIVENKSVSRSAPKWARSHRRGPAGSAERAGRRPFEPSHPPRRRNVPAKSCS